jgi:hypothetical protein
MAASKRSTSRVNLWAGIPADERGLLRAYRMLDQEDQEHLRRYAHHLVNHRDDLPDNVVPITLTH